MLNRIVLVSGLILTAPLVQANDPLPVVQNVALERYAGVWYEVARLPNRFERDCVGDISATYNVLPSGRVDVLNQCRTGNGTMKSARGLARSSDGSTSRLEVRFAPAWLSLLPMVWGDYWIIDLASDYTWSLVGSPDRKYLWVLSRQPEMNPEQLRRLIEKAKALGFDTNTLVFVNNASVAGSRLQR